VEQRWLYFSSRGRLGPRDFRNAYISLLVVGVLTSLIPVVGLLIGLGCTYGTCCVVTKRLHDMGRSGWLQAAALVPWIATVAWGAVLLGPAAGKNDAFADLIGSNTAMQGAFVVSLAASLAFLAWIAFARGDVGPNPYGEGATGVQLR